MIYSPILGRQTVVCLRLLALRFSFALDSSNHMSNGHKGMVPNHPGTTIPHHLSYLLAHFGFVTMNSTCITSRLCLGISTTIQALRRVMEQGLAIRTESSVCSPVSLATIQAYHRFYCMFLFCNAFHCCRLRQ